MLPVFAMRDMIDVLIMHVHFLPDVLAVRQLSREIYSWCRAVLTVDSGTSYAAFSRIPWITS
jgi:hypothetical protein